MLTDQMTQWGAEGAARATVDIAATRTRLAALAADFERGRVDLDCASMLQVAHTAVDLGISSVLVSVLLGDDEPMVARERAFGRLSAQLDARLDEIRPVAMHPATC